MVLMATRSTKVRLAAFATAGVVLMLLFVFDMQSLPINKSWLQKSSDQPPAAEKFRPPNWNGISVSRDNHLYIDPNGAHVSQSRKDLEELLNQMGAFELFELSLLDEFVLSIGVNGIMEVISSGNYIGSSHP